MGNRVVHHKNSDEKRQEKQDKFILLKDLANRFPYGNATKLYVRTDENHSWEIRDLDPMIWADIKLGKIEVDNVKVLLKPMSRLTEKDMSDLTVSIFGYDIYDVKDPDTNDWINFKCNGDIEFIFYRRSYKDLIKFYDYCYAHSIDVNNLNDRGLVYDKAFS